MRTISISDTVHAFIEKHGKFPETYDDVLRRLFKLPSSDVPNGREEFPVVAPPPKSSENNRTRRNLSTREMKAWVEGTTLWVAFEHETPRRFELPSDKNDKNGIRQTRDSAVDWATTKDATDGQKNAIGKAISGAGYYLTRPRGTYK
jgi:hypothetical protein